MDNIYTYEVNHGKDSPGINGKTEVNGGKLISCSFEGQLTRNQKTREILEEVIYNHEPGDEVMALLGKINELL